MTTRPRPAVQPPHPWHFPDAETHTLDNGLDVWIYHVPGQHVVASELVLDLPLSAEPRVHEGVATITLRASDEGTLAHPDGGINECLEAAGATFEGSASWSSTMCLLEVPRTRLAHAFELFAEIVRTPAYDPTDVDRHRELRLAEWLQVKANASSTASLVLRSVLHPSDARESRPAAGTEVGVPEITRELVSDFHERHWGPRGSTLILAGEFDDDPVELARRWWGDWAPTTIDHAHLPQRFTPGNARLVHLVDRPGSVQAELRIAGPGADRTSPDWAAFQVATSAMGGMFNSRLNRVLREERGYTYGANLVATPGRGGGTWTMSASCRTDVMAEACREALALLALPEPLTTSEVGAAVAYQLGVAPLRYDTAAGIVGQAAAVACAGVGPDYVNTHFARVATMDAERASAALSSRVTAESSHIVIVGDAETLRPALQALDFEVVDAGL
ncbi:MAG TPA: pitrilysin family protein [Propionibacteriaceae bacterium]|nr:pitrilysin family protein [Propionibacteriaceae bacterium]